MAIVVDSRDSRSLHQAGASSPDARKQSYEGGVGQDNWGSGALDEDQPLHLGAGMSSHAAKS